MAEEEDKEVYVPTEFELNQASNESIKVCTHTKTSNPFPSEHIFSLSSPYAGACESASPE